MKKYTEDIWEDFLTLCEKNSDRFNVPQFSWTILLFTFKLMFDCAPNKDEVKKITETCMKEAYEWHLATKNEDEGGNDE